MSSLNDICYQQIKDNYYYGLFGDFKLIIDKNSGFFNATKLCQQGNKNLRHWLENKQSKELIDYYNLKSDSRNSGHHFIEVKRGNRDENYNKIISGTYLRKELILSIALWISNDFYDKVYKIIENYFINEFNEKYKNNEEKLKKKLNKIEIKMNELKLKNQKYQDDVSPKTVIPSKHNRLSIIQKNKENSNYPFYVIRCQNSIYKKTLSDLKKKYPNSTIVYEIKYNPNSINLFNRIKENIAYIDTYFNHLKLIERDLHTFIKDIQKLIIKL